MYGREESCIQGFGRGNLGERDYLENPGVDGRIILKWIFRSLDVELWIASIWLRIGRGYGHL
jgi:hypothetical protein